MSATEKNLDHLAEDLRRITRHTEGLLKAIPSDIGGELHQVRRQTEAALHRMQRSTRNLERRTMRTMRQGVRATDEWVHEKPYPVAAVVLGVGFLLGLIIGHRR